MRKAQLSLEKPQDLLLLVDMDADDEFWVGFDIPFLSHFFSTAQGLRGLVKNVVDLDYVRFTTPDRYLTNHDPVGTITIGQDTADGSFDGLSSWAEKWSNHRLWTGLERARILALQTKRLMGETPHLEADNLLSESFETRLKILSTTHFGMAAPVMNLTRERVARDLVSQAVTTAKNALHTIQKPMPQGAFSLYDYVRGTSTDQIQYQAHPSRALLRLPLSPEAPADFILHNHAGQPIPSTVIQKNGHRELLFIENFQPAERKDYSINEGQLPISPEKDPILVTDTSIQNELLKLTWDADGQVTSLSFNGEEQALAPFLNSAVTYAGNHSQVTKWQKIETHSSETLGLLQQQGQIHFKGNKSIHFEREIIMGVGLPYLYLKLRVTYPNTSHQGFNKGKAQRLEQTWDQRWQEVLPCEIRPALLGTRKKPLRVWKHDYCDYISSFDLDYGRFSKNDELNNVNNQITHAWLAVSDGQRGLLVAQNADVLSNAAFCPLRTRKQENDWYVRFNPFGSYWGKQYRYGTADTGLGNLLATTFSASDHINPYAPSFNGREQEFSILIAPYIGDKPPVPLQHDAEAFAYPYLVVSDGHLIRSPGHQNWDGGGLGEIPGRKKQVKVRKDET